MAQPVFPTLSRYPIDTGFNKRFAFNNAQFTSFDDGHVLAMAKATDVPMQWRVRWERMTETDRSTLMAFYEGDANWGVEPIKWTDPTDSTAYFVHIQEVPEVRSEGDDTDEWTISLTFLEALGSYT